MMKNILNCLLVFTIALFPFSVQADCLSGDCKNGKGKAIYYDTENTSFTYEGNFVNGQWQGEGLIIIPNKSTYKGTFKNGEVTGKGEIVYADGNKYVGEVLKFTKEGEGLFTYKNGQTFKGIFKGDGVWNGEGYVYFSDKSYYKGTIQEGKQQGKGFFRFEDGTTYEGDFINGIISGQGTVNYHDGSKYVGAVSNSVRNGYGKLYDKYGKLLFEGKWVNDNAQQNTLQKENEQYKQVFNRCYNGFERLTYNGQTGNADIHLCCTVSDDLSLTGTYTFTININGKNYIYKSEIYGSINKSKNSFTFYDNVVLRKDDVPNGHWTSLDSGVTLTIYNDENHKGYYVLKGKSVNGNPIELSDW